MSATIRSILALMAVLALTACASTPPGDHEVRNSRTFNAYEDAVWESLIQFFTANSIPIKTIEKASGVVYADRMSTVSTWGAFLDWADCGLVPLNTPFQGLAEFNVFVKSMYEDETVVTVTTTFQMNWVPLSTAAPGPFQLCNSRGVLEQMVLDFISASLDSPDPSSP